MFGPNIHSLDDTANGQALRSSQRRPKTANSGTSYSNDFRQRYTSWETNSPTYFSSTIVPANPDTRVLSTLINTLTALSDSGKQPQRAFTPSSPETLYDPFPPPSSNFFTDLSCHENRPKTASASDSLRTEEDDDNCAPAPVAGYTSKSLSRPRIPASDRWTSHKFAKRSRLDLRPSKSSKTLRRPDSSRNSSRIGTPIVERAADTSIRSSPGSSHSKASRNKSPFSIFFASKDIDEPFTSHPMASKSSLSNIAASASPAGSMKGFGDDDAQNFHLGAHIRRFSSISDSTTQENKIPSPLSPSSREDLEDHLIPSRRSSLRVSSKGKRRSQGSRDLSKPVNIDQDLVEEDDSTLRRIKELQRAKEKRNSEWRSDSRRPERSEKRSSAPAPGPLQLPPALRSSWYSEGTPTPERSPNLSSRITAGDLVTMPAFVEVDENQEPLTPVEQPSELKRNPSISLSATQISPNSKKHRKRLSDSFRRSTSTRRPAVDDVKSVADEVEAFLAAPRLTQKIRHPRTGRTIAFSEVGDPNGFVVFVCVGMGLTRYVTSFYDEVAKAQNLRLITPDRPGVGESQVTAEGFNTPLGWVDDVAVICSSLGIEKFSLLAHSAGAIYALAVALKMPQYVRGRIHLLGPWIPPSQLAASGPGRDVKGPNLPTSHKLLSMLPASLMKAANSRFLVATSASIEPRSKKDRKKDRASAVDLALDTDLFNEGASVSTADIKGSSMLPTPDASPQRLRPSQSYQNSISETDAASFIRSPPISPSPGLDHIRNVFSPTPSLNTPTNTNNIVLGPAARQKLYNTTLTHRTWSLATLNANPAVDLIICLERRRPIGFRYTDVTRAVVIHHGELDNRVPLDNVKWLSTAMKRCELRVLEGEGHGLMASATVMSNVLMEVGKEWEEWHVIAMEEEKKRMLEVQREMEAQKRREREMRRGPRW